MKMFKKVLVGLSAGVVLCIFSSFLLASFGIGFENIGVKREINNPHVNADFKEWKNISVEDRYAFSIPQKWTLQETNRIYEIYDECGYLWAVGSELGHESGKFQNYRDLMESCIHLSIPDFTLTPISHVLMRGSEIYQITYADENVKKYYVISLRRGTADKLVFIVFADLLQNAEEYDFAEAIVYSYAWGNSLS